MKFVFVFLKTCSIIYPYTFSCWLKLKMDKFYSLWIKNSIGNTSRHTIICKGLDLHGGEFISIGNHTYIARNCILSAWNAINGITPKILIGDNVSLGEYNHITSANSVIIEDGVLTGRWVTISDNNHGAFIRDSLDFPAYQRPIVSKGGVFVGKNVWIGDKATILSGVNVGQGSIVAANAVVTKDVPPYSIVAGNPAKIVKHIE